MERLPDKPEGGARLLTRRRFLTVAVLATGGALAGFLALLRYDTWWRPSVKRGYDEIAEQELSDSPTGPLNSETKEALLSATRAIAGTPIEMGHYEDYFRWHSENLPRYRYIYEKFREKADNAAQQLCGSSFAACDPASQRAILEQDFQVRSTYSRRDFARIGISHKDRLVFDRYIFKEVLSLFTRTDAWTLLGYGSWPGTPRGLEAYKQAPL